jgi:serine/threonine protein phosphatase PrpC
LEYAAISDKGVIREQNEDFWNIVLDLNRNPIAFIVADGMGGHQAGDVASRMAVEIISDDISRFIESKDTGNSLSMVFEKAIYKANDEIYRYSVVFLGGASIGTTLTAGIIEDNILTIAHIGDSRFYIIRDGKIKKLTRDHSFVEELVEKGVLDQEEANKHPLRNQITRALGYEEQIQIDFYKIEVKKQDTYLFCTDGLTMKISSMELLSILMQEKTLDEILKSMVKLANERGGDDNITAIAIRV